LNNKLIEKVRTHNPFAMAANCVSMLSANKYDPYRVVKAIPA